MIFSTIGKARIICLATIWTMSLWSISPDSSAYSRMASAVIKSANGMPCFTITSKEEARNGVPILGALTVSDRSMQPIRKVWEFSTPDAPEFPLRARSCIRYGDMPAGAEGSNAEKLIPGHFYRVFLNGSPKDPSDPTYGYQGKFCIAKTAGGGQQIIPVTSDMPAWIEEICPASSPSR